MQSGIDKFSFDKAVKYLFYLWLPSEKDDKDDDEYEEM
jgi:hypothetical protein